MTPFRTVAGLNSLCIVFKLQAQFLTTTLPNIIPPVYVYADQAMMDLDNDGDLDGLVVGTGPGVLAYLNDGLYTYEFPRLIHADPDTWAAAFGDLNGDGLGDLVCVSGDWLDDQQLVVVLQTAPFLFQSIAIDSVTDSPGPLAPYLVDLDEDGDIDILWPTSDTPVHLNIGDGTFLTGAPLSGDAGTLIEFGDLDGNGTLDLLQPSSNGLDWFPGLGDGTFALPQNLIGDPGDPMTDMKLADMDGDQDLDLVLCQGNWSPGFIRLYLNDGTGGYGAPVDLFGGITDLNYHILVADLDGDGDQDLVTDEPLGQRLYRNLGNGTFDSGEGLFEGGYSGASYRTAVDVDLDGDLDITAADLRIGINNGTGVMRMEKKLTYHPFAGTRTADMDGDGDMDIATITRDWLRNEDGVIDGWVAVNDTSSGTMDEVHDVDLDGDMDMITLFGQDGNGYLQVLNNDGNGYFQPDTTYLITPYAGSHFAMGDLDQDGDLDAVLEPTQNEVAWFRNNGSMALTYAGPISDQYETVFTVQVLDVTGDGLLDVLVYRTDSTSISVGTGGGTFTTQTYSYSDGFAPPFASGDVDSDGFSDLVAGHYLHRSDGVGGYLPAEAIMDNGVDQADLVDMDQDNLIDLVFTKTFGSGSVYVGWCRNEGTFFGAPDSLAVSLNDCNGCGGMGYSLLDIDNDGDMDIVSAVGSQHVQFRSHRNVAGGSCSMAGSVFVDLDQDQVQGPDEPGLPWAVVNTDEPSSFVTLDSLGNWTNLADTGTYVVQCTPPFPWWQLSTSPSAYTVQLATAGTTATGIHFGYYPAIDTISIGSSIASAPTRCNFDIHQWLSYRNQGTIAPLHGQVRFVKDPAVGFLASLPLPDAISGDTLLWDFQGLAILEERTIVLDMHMPDVGFMGDTIHGELTVVANDDGDLHTQTMSTHWESVISCAYDPNDKQVEPVGFGEYGAIDIGTQALTYVIRFQNTGSDTAFTVTLTDQLDTLLDRADLTVLSSSHDLAGVVIAPDGLLTFQFENILLPPAGSDSLGSQGFVRFRLGILGEPPEYSQVTNTARIYFDYNPPIVTNTVVNTLVDCSSYVPTITELQDGWLVASPGIAYQWYLNGWATPDYGPMVQALDQGYFSVEVTTAFGCHGISPAIQLGMDDLAPGRLLVYPNPTHQDLTVEFPNALSGDANLQVVDQLGRMVMVMRCAGSKQLALNMKGVQSGVYLLRVVDANGLTGMNGRVVVD